MTAVAGIAVQILASTVLLLAGAQKLAAPARFADTLRALDLPGTRVLRTAVPLLELATAVLLLTGAARPAAALLVAGLGTGFGAAGLIATLRRTRIPCACFGPLDSGTLGWRQVALVPVWLLVAAGTLAWPGIGGLTGLAVLAAVAQVAGVVAAGYLMVPWVRERRAARVVTSS